MMTRVTFSGFFVICVRPAQRLARPAMRRKINLVFLFLCIAGTLPAQKLYGNVAGVKTEAGRIKIYPGIFFEHEIKRSHLQFALSFPPKFMQEEVGRQIFQPLQYFIMTGDTANPRYYWKDQEQASTRGWVRFELRYAYFISRRNSSGQNKGFFLGAATAIWPLKQKRSADYYEDNNPVPIHADTTRRMVSGNAGWLAGWRMLAGKKMVIDVQLDLPFYGGFPQKYLFGEYADTSSYLQTHVEAALSLGFRF
jgi:hypothetical protein